MSWQPGTEAQCLKHQGAVRLLIEPREKDLGGFSVRRVLPSKEARSVGPFVFFDHMGPADFAPGKGIDVRPHPHIGLATITWLFDGQILHRDSLGSVQNIKPGAVNWMTAGRGIVHSERSPGEARAKGERLHGIQAWIALPLAHEDTEPAFEHYPADALPKIKKDGAEITLIAGKAFGLQSEVKTLSPQFYAEVVMEEGAGLDMPQVPERAVYLVEGELNIGDETLKPATMAVLSQGVKVTLKAAKQSLLMVLGGEPLDGRRHVWWNFVSSSRDKIEAAKDRWQSGGFPEIPGEDEFIPLPD